MSIKEDIEARRLFLDKLVDKARKGLRNAPQGTLRISSSGGRVQYYHRKQPSDRVGEYIPKKELKLISALAQKEYYEKTYRLAKQEQKAIDAYLKRCPVIMPELYYEVLSESRKELVIPLCETEEMFRKRWESVEYEGNPIETASFEYYSDKGEKVRSKSEIIIANMLAKAEVPYRYEFPVYLETMGTVYPDFTVLNTHLRKEFYWEHLGMMDDEEYSEKAIRKIAAYCANGIYPGEKLILTFETRSTPLNIRQIKEMIEHYF